MWSSCLQRSPASTIIHDLPKVVESTNVSKEPVGENASKVHMVFSTPPQRKEEGKKRGLNYLSEKTDVSNHPAKKRMCRPKVADDKFSLTTKKAKVIPKPVKARRVSPKKDSQRKRMYVRKKKQQLNVVVHPPKVTCDVVVGRDDVVFEETLIISDTTELFKAACQRALVFNDENLTHMSAFTPQVIDVAPEPPSPEDGKFCEKAVQPPLRREENLNNHEAEERYNFSDDFPNLAESKYFTGASNETLDYEEVNTVSTTLDMSEPYIDMELKDLESLRLERDSSKEEIVYVRKRKTQPSINIQHNFCFMEATSTEEVRANENKSRAQSVHGGSVLDSDGWKIITVSCMKGLDSGVVNGMSVSQTNENKKHAISSSDYKNEDRFVILHVPLISNGRNMRACQCIQLMRKCNSGKVKIKKQRRMLRKQRVDMSRLISSFQTPKQLTSKKPISQYQSIPTRRPRSKLATRRRDILFILTGPPFNKLATHTVEQQSSLQVPQTDILPTHDQPPLLDPTYNNNQLLNHVQLCVTNEQEFICEGRGGLQTIDDPDHQSLLYNNQLLDPHREPGPTTGDNSVNSHFLVPYYEPSELLHGQELLSRVDNSITVLNDTSNQALVASVKKKKVIPHVNFDSRTMPMWRALMGKGDSCDHQCNENEESKKWWHEERRVFKEKIQAFIYCMHQIQGNRRFSQWKGSVLDSVMGVFLTQNVSDHLSSSAYMSLASKYPIGPQPTHGQKVASEEIEVDDNSEESCGRNVVSITELLVQESLNDRILDSKQAALQSVGTDSRNEFGERNPVKDNVVIPTVGLCGFEEWLSQQEQVIVIQPQDSSHPKSGRKDFLSQLEQNTSPQTPSHPNSETGELHSQQEYTTQLHPLSHSNSESTELHQKEQTTETQNSFHPKSETDELPFHNEKRKRHQDSTHPKTQKSKAPVIDWLKIKTKYCKEKRERSKSHTDSVDWDAVRRAPSQEVADAIKKRGQHNILAASMQNALNRIFSELGSLDLEWLRDTPPDVTKNFLMSIEGLGLKSVECIRLLALEQVAFPVDTNVGRIAVRLGWVDLKDVPEGQQFHLLDQYPMMDAIQQYLWPRLCELDQLTLYELHYQMITFGKIFCKKRSPYCNECPLRASCKHFASAYVSACLPITDGASAGTSQSLPLLGPYTEMPASPQQSTEMPASPQQSTEMPPSPQPCFEIPTMPQPYTEMHTQVEVRESMNPTVEFPRTPESEHEDVIEDIEDLYTDASEIPSIVLNDEEFIANVSKYIDGKKFENGAEISNAIVISAQAARIPARKLKNIKDLRTEHLVYEIPDDHPLLPLHGLGERDLNDPCFYLLSILSPDESMTLSSENVKENSNCLPENLNSKEGCIENDTCQQHDAGYVFGSFMIPCRTAMKGRFPLNGTYFQVNEVFADDESSHRPVKIPRSYLWNLKQRIVYCGSSASAIATGLSIKEIQVCFWKDYVCVRGINRRTGEPKELVERLHRLRTATQTKRSSGTVQLNPKRKRNKLGSQ